MAISIKVTFLRRSNGRSADRTPGRAGRGATRRPVRRRQHRRRGRNRKRTAPSWRRLPELLAHLRGERGAVRRFGPALLIAATVVLLTVGLTVGYRFVTTSDSFAIYVIEVHGNEVLSEDAVRLRLGVAQGDNIFLAEVADLARTLEADPWIDRASVRRELPHTLVVEIEEHQPVALVELGELYLADRGGHVFKRARIDRGEGAGMPVITGLSRDDYVRDADRVERSISDAVTLVDDYERDASRPALGEVHLHPRHGVSLLTYDSAMAVRLGHGVPDTLSQRLARFDTAWQALTPDERDRARIVHADGSARDDRVTVGFEQTE